MFLRAENTGCGTSTTGTGTLTLAAVPAGTGLIDPVTAFGTSGSFIFRYVITEFTDSTFTVPKQVETGYGTLALNATLTSVTLTRTVVTTGVVATPAYTTTAGQTPMSIGTAANTLVFCGPTAADLPDALPFYSTSGITTQDGLGFGPVQAALSAGNVSLTAGISNGSVVYQRVWLQSSGLLKSVSMRVTTISTSGGNSTVEAALYDIATTGLPGAKVLNFGTIAAGALGTVNTTITATAAAAKYIPAGFYIQGILPIGGTGSSGTPTLKAATSCAPSPFGSQLSSGVGGPVGVVLVASQSTLADPATTTSVTVGTVLATEIDLAYKST